MIVEFRIPLPIAVDDFEVAQLYMITRLQESVTGGGEGVVVLKNEPYERSLDFRIGLITGMVTRRFLRSVAFLSRSVRDSTH